MVLVVVVPVRELERYLTVGIDRGDRRGAGSEEAPDGPRGTT